VSSIRHRRVATIIASALLGLMLVVPGIAVARPPGWAITPVADPPTVVNGADGGWIVTVSNGGKSNISAVYMVTNIPTDDPLVDPVPTYVSTATWTGQTGPEDPCSDALSGPLLCSFGNIVAGGSVTVTIAFSTPETGTGWAFKFLGFGNGNTPSDGDNNASHGDFVEGTASVALTTDKNFAGEFSTDTTSITNNGDLGPKNIQFGSLTPPVANVGVSLQDGLNDNAFSCATVTQCAKRFGEWTRLYVANGATFAGGIKVVTTILGSRVPSGANVDNIVLIHASDFHGTHVISARCTGDGLNTDGADLDELGDECITVTKVGNNFQIVAWLLSNGGTRAGY